MPENSIGDRWWIHEARPLSRRQLAVVLALVALSVGCDGRNPGGTAPTSLAVTAVTPSTASAYTRSTVQIAGAGFRPGVSVRIGGLTADVQSITPASVTVLVPAGPPGTVDVTVFNPNSEEVRLLRAFTYLDFGVSELTPREAYPTQVVRVIGTSLLPGTRVTFAGVDVEVRSTSPAEMQVKVPASGTGTVDVVVIHTDGRTASAGSFTFRNFNVTLSVSATSVAAGAPMSVTYANAHCICNDFVAEDLRLYRVGDPDEAAVWREELWTEQGTVTLAAPMVPGLYEFRLFSRLYPQAVLGRSAAFTVTGGQ